MLLLRLPGFIIWVWIWVLLFLLGGAGLIGAIAWGRHIGWRNLDEILRGLGTVLISAGMLLLLKDWLPVLAIFCFFVSLALFVIAFMIGQGTPDVHRED